MKTKKAQKPIAHRRSAEAQRVIERLEQDYKKADGMARLHYAEVVSLREEIAADRAACAAAIAARDELRRVVDGLRQDVLLLASQKRKNGTGRRAR